MYNFIDPLYKVGSPRQSWGSWGNVHITGVETSVKWYLNSDWRVPVKLSRLSPFLNNWLHYSNYGEEKIKKAVTIRGMILQVGYYTNILLF